MPTFLQYTDTLGNSYLLQIIPVPGGYIPSHGIEDASGNQLTLNTDGSVNIKSIDGGIATLGTMADAVVSSVTGSVSAISLLKTLVSQLNGPLDVSYTSTQHDTWDPTATDYTPPAGKKIIGLINPGTQGTLSYNDPLGVNFTAPTGGNDTLETPIPDYGFTKLFGTTNLSTPSTGLTGLWTVILR